MALNTFRVNVAEHTDHYSQRNNEVDPLIACQVTAMIGAAACIPSIWGKLLDSPNYKKLMYTYKQQEDCLRVFCLDRGLNPERHQDLSEGFNSFVGSKVTSFSTSVKIDDLFSDLFKGLPSVISGSFPGFPTKRQKGPLGHVVILCGVEWDSDKKVNPPTKVIIRDPYGNTLKDWQGSGKDVELSWAQFMDWVKPVGDPKFKWAHRFIA